MTLDLARPGDTIARGLAPVRQHSMEVRNVHKSFGPYDILTGMNLNFVDNAITTILGPSGTGKSVLIKHLVGLLEPDQGEVVIFGQDIWKISKQERYDLRKRFGVLFQDGALFGSMNIFDNVCFPLRKHTDMREKEIRDLVMDRLQEVGLEGAAAKLPSEVSGGMRKRAGFARALILDPDIVMFDEPDSGLDPVRTSLLNDVILDMHERHKGTYMVVTHDMATARKVSDYIGVVWKGKCIHYSEAQAAFDSDSPFVRQFLAGSSAGPLGMD
ncbi:ABC transporter ATP-binding protein [Nocardioides daejeonensis]|uniref:ABC transporter ATP-binding protein n=1 Tax=Nocardioides daejeonensis TaxID=1046556 RepID=UPI000D74229F|nr:ATP-binding cassette domain-containing protein [Nocardioides daejeonensis]